MARVYLVAGATSGIGVEIAKGLARLPQAQVIILGRDERKAQAVTQSIRDETGNQNISKHSSLIASFPFHRSA